MSDARPIRGLIRQRLGLVVVIVIVVVAASASRVSNFFTELWWFEDIGARGVFTTIFWTRVGLGAVFGAALGVIIAVNLAIARRLRPMVLPASPREAIIERYRQVADPYLPWLIVGVSVVFALTSGGAASTQWQDYLLWRNGPAFGTVDPLFERDIGFFVFDLPWLSFVQSWLGTAMLLALLTSAGAHYLLGGIRPEAPRDKVTVAVKTHLSVLLVLLLAARGWSYWLARYELDFSTRSGHFTGASYTDDHAVLPGLNLMLILSVVAIALVLVSVRRRGFLLPGAAVVLLLVAGLILRSGYPALVQYFRVRPQPLQRELPYIEDSLTATRAAYGLENVERTGFTVEDDFGPEDVAEHEVTLKNVRLWDPDILRTTYKQIQAIRPYYDFFDVDVDRYVLDGEVRQVMLSVRELGTQGLAEQNRNWQNLHLTYTHGYGIVSSQVNTASAQGQPVFLASDIPPRGSASELIPEQAGIYFGEELEEYSIVRTSQQELDYESEEVQQHTTYSGEGGVPLGGLLRRLAFAIDFREPNMLLSRYLTPESEVIFHRTIQERVHEVAPYLYLDADPYPVVLDGRTVWVQDGYTVSAFYPYSARAIFDANERGKELFPAPVVVNYVRNSVKAVVDAYDGSLTLYVADGSDPIVKAWRAALPDLYASGDDMPAELRSHLRYPQDLFGLQTDVFATYHMRDPEVFFSGADAWAIPFDAAKTAVAREASASAAPIRLEPFYVLMRLPGEEREEFLLVMPYHARGKENMIAWVAGRSDPEHYGELFAIQFPPAEAVQGTVQVYARIEQDPTVSPYITLRAQSGSEVIRGNIIILPIERSILYVEPLFTKNPQAEIPELAKVVVVLGDDVVMADTLNQALDELLGAAPPGEEPPPVEEPTETVEALIAEALEEFDLAQQALEEGDLAAYQEHINAAHALLEQIAELEGVAPTPSPSPSPVATTSP